MSIIPNDFNWNEYLRINSDVNQNSSKEETIYHYINHGSKENRQYKITIPNDFIWKTYLKINKDLNENWTKEEVFDHYINYGSKENRQYKISIPFYFDWKIYLKINPELPKVWNEKETTYHYANYGFFENKKFIYNINLNIVDYTHSQQKTCMNYSEVMNPTNLKLLNEYNLSEDCKYILILDFPNLGGGTEFFINTIISKYKKNQTFIIARNFNNMIQLNINNEDIIGNYKEKYAIDFINKCKKNINKIFINHIFNHSCSFIKFIMNLNIEITTITHDYFFINEKPQAYYHEIKYDSSKIDLKKINTLIVQNEENINIFKHFLNENQNVVISPLPDFKNSAEMYTTNNHNIVVGIIGAVGVEKGEEMLRNIIQHIKDNKLPVKVIVFGYSNIFYEHQYKYSNIHELNQLLKIHKPNMLFETSIWPETYSYTLTIAMLTQLPILTFKKHFKNVIENRVKKYDKKYFYENINEFFILVDNLKQNYFYTIDTTIYFNSFWDEYFGTKTPKEETKTPEEETKISDYELLQKS
jgi:hypothetical protein